MEPFKTHRGLIAVLDRANVDTDQIIPKQFLKSIKRTGFGENLFFDWRYLKDGSVNPDFVLNQKRFQGASILVSGNNFGCGSSREHAVWAIAQYGIRALVAPYKEEQGIRIPAFADIFKNNCSKNGILTIEFGENEVREIISAVNDNIGLEATIDLEGQKLIMHDSKRTAYRFQIDRAVKSRLIQGLDDIGRTLQHEESIRTFESRHDCEIGDSR